jgi:hypothetical protein
LQSPDGHTATLPELPGELCKRESLSWPARKTQEGMGLRKAADVMQDKVKLGQQFQNY